MAASSGCWGLLLLASCLCGLAAAVSSEQQQQRTVMSWIAADPPWSDAAAFILSGPAKGAVNAVSLGMWAVEPVAPGAAAFRLTFDNATLREFQRVWRGPAARGAGLRTYPLVGVPGDIQGMRAFFAAPNRAAVIADLAAAVAAAGVDGVNIDWEPDVDVLNRTHNPTFADGLAFAGFLDELARALHALPGRPLVTMDSLSVGSACWSAPPAASPTHVWDRLPCPWIRRFWNLDALAESGLDVIIPMDTYDTNETAFDWDLYQYQKYFDISRLGFGLYPAEMVHTPAFAARRVQAIAGYSGRWISTWVIGTGDPHSPNMSMVEQTWAPFIPPLRQFLHQQGAR